MYIDVLHSNGLQGFHALAFPFQMMASSKYQFYQCMNYLQILYSDHNVNTISLLSISSKFLVINLLCIYYLSYEDAGASTCARGESDVKEDAGRNRWSFEYDAHETNKIDHTTKYSIPNMLILVYLISIYCT